MKRSAQPLPSSARTNARLDFNSEEAKLGLIIVAHELAPMVMPQLRAQGDILVERAAGAAHRLPQGLERLEAVARLRGMDAKPLAGGVVHYHEHRHLAVSERVGARGIRAPQLVLRRRAGAPRPRHASVRLR